MTGLLRRRHPQVRYSQNNIGKTSQSRRPWASILGLWGLMTTGATRTSIRRERMPLPNRPGVRKKAAEPKRDLVAQRTPTYGSQSSPATIRERGRSKAWSSALQKVWNADKNHNKNNSTQSRERQNKKAAAWWQAAPLHRESTIKPVESKRRQRCRSGFERETTQSPKVLATRRQRDDLSRDVMEKERKAPTTIRKEQRPVNQGIH